MNREKLELKYGLVFGLVAVIFCLWHLITILIVGSVTLREPSKIINIAEILMTGTAIYCLLKLIKKYLIQNKKQMINFLIIIIITCILVFTFLYY